MAQEETSDDFKVITLASDADWAKVLVAAALGRAPAMVPPELRAPDASPTMAQALDVYRKAFPNGLPYQVFLDEPSGGNNLGDVARSWGIKAVPESFLIDRQGRIRYYFINKRNWTSSIALTCIRALMDE